MADDNEPTNTPSPRASLRKLAYIVAALFIVWSVMGQIIPRLIFPAHKESPTKDTIQISSPAATPETVQPRDEQIATLNNRIAQLETKLHAFDEWQQHPTASVDNNRVAHLEDVIAKQQATLNAMQSAFIKAEARGGFTPLKEAIERGEPFDTALQQLAQLAQDRSDINELLAPFKPFAANGITSLSMLQIQFSVLLPRALAAGQDSNPIARNLQSLIRIRKVGDQPGANDEAVLARAEAALDRGDIAACLKNTGSLSPAAKEMMSAWNDRAQAYLTTHEALRNLQLALTAP